MRFSILFFLLTWGSIAYASDWVSPIDVKYRQKNPALFAKFETARNLIDSYRGKQRALADADQILRYILTSDPKYAPVYREYGRLILAAGHINTDIFREGTLEQSEQAVLRSIDLEPRYADSYVLLGHIYTEMRRYHDATQALVKAEEIGTNIPWLDLNWANLLIIQGQYDEALNRFNKVIAEKTSNKTAHSVALAGITRYHRIKRDYVAAKKSFQNEIAYEPNSAWKWVNYSEFLLFYYGDIDGAIESGEKALQIMDFGAGRFLLASALYSKWARLEVHNRHNESRQYFERAWSLYPYPERIIQRAKKHQVTRITALKLKEWRSSQPSQNN